MKNADAILAPLPDAQTREIAGVRVDVVRAGASRVKRIIYPPGFRWSKDLKAVVGTDLCMHAHVGFLARGRIHVQYADGCQRDFTAPEVIVVDPGHDGWVKGDEAAVVIEFDFEGETASRLGMPPVHTHGATV